MPVAGKRAHFQPLVTRLVESALPVELARFGPPICAALCCLLEGLPPADLASLLREQVTFPEKVSPEVRLTALARQCPTLHKLGQVLARQPRLPLVLRNEFQRLESLPPSAPAALVQQAIRDEFPDLDQRGVKLAARPLAEASVAVVQSFDYRDPLSGRSQRGVFKVLKPGIKDRMNRELDLFSSMGQLLDERCEAHDLPQIAYREVFEIVRDTLRHEVDLSYEQRNLAEAARSHVSRPNVLIPRLFPFQSPRITSMERVSGRRLGLQIDDGRSTPPDLGRTIVDAFLVRPLVSPEPSLLFHADPHAGNLYVTDQGQLAILDWSLIGHLSQVDRNHLRTLFMGALLLAPALIRGALASISSSPPNAEALDTLIHQSLTELASGRPPGFFWVLDLLDQAVQKAGLSPRGDLILFRKSLLMVEGVLADLLGPRPVVERTLFAALAGVALRDPPLPWPLPQPPGADRCPVTWADLCSLALVWPDRSARLARLRHYSV